MWLLFGIKMQESNLFSSFSTFKLYFFINLWFSLSTTEKLCTRLVLIEIALFKPMFTMDTYMIGSLSCN